MKLKGIKTAAGLTNNIWRHGQYVQISIDPHTCEVLSVWHSSESERNVYDDRIMALFNARHRMTTRAMRHEIIGTLALLAEMGDKRAIALYDALKE